MDKKENNNPMLSFDKLREGLGIEGDLPQVNEPETPKPVEDVKSASEKAIPIRGKSVFENGIKFSSNSPLESFSFSRIFLVSCRFSSEDFCMFWR